NAYGSGKVMSVAEKGKETKYFITIDGHTVPVRVTPIEEHGVRYDVVDGEKIYPVNFNGKEWYFEPATSPFVSKKLADEVMKNMDEFESIKDPSVLSAPDERRLMKNSLGRAYIKIYDHYIPLIQLHKNGYRYHLVKKDTNQSMTVVVFDPEIEQFRFETELERKQAIEATAPSQSGILHHGGKDTKRRKVSKASEEGAPSTSQEGAPSTSQEGASQMIKNVVLPPANQLPPNPPGHADEWTKLRQAIPFEEKFEEPRVEDDSVPLGDFSKFLPEKPPVYYNDNEWVKGQIMQNILQVLPSNPKLDFRVYVGLNSDDVPEYIKLFREKLKINVTSAQEKCKTVMEKCDKLLKEAVFAATPEGQYLINMFDLSNVPNKEEILKEIITRLSSIAKKGEAFLQETEKFDYKNIWIVSTELKRQPGAQEYRSLYREVPQAYALVSRYDPECRITIYADTFHLDPSIRKDAELRKNPHETILHETTHLIAGTEDVIRYYDNPAGFSMSGEETISDFITNFPDLLTSEPFKIFVNHLADSLNKPTISVKTVANALYTNPMLRSNFQMMDAEMVMILLRDLADGRAFNERPVIDPPIVKRSINKKELGMETMFMYLVLPYILGDGIFERNIQLNKAQEQMTTRTTDAVEITKATSNRSFLNLVTSSIERSVNTSSQQISKMQKELILQH
ncbi:MAG: hypothetical protein ACI32O_07120, partial [Enterococcus sp.]